MTVATKDRHGRPILDRAAGRAAHARARDAGATEYRSGPLTKLGTHRLPGVLAQTELTEWKDSNHEQFALVHTPATNQYAVTIECHPDDRTLDDDDTAAAVDRVGTRRELMGSRRGPVIACLAVIGVIGALWLTVLALDAGYALEVIVVLLLLAGAIHLFRSLKDPDGTR